MTITNSNVIYQVSNDEASVVGHTSSFDCSGNSDLQLLSEVSDGNSHTYQVTSVEANAFYDCKLKLLTLPNNLRVVKASAFDKCRLTAIEFPVSLEEIYDWAFSSNSFKSIFIPKNVKLIEIGALHYNSQLESISVDKDNKYFSTSQTSPGLFDKALKNLILVPATLDHYEIPKSVEYISPRAFPGITFSTLIIPSSVKRISWGIFTYCKNFETININGNPIFEGSLFVSTYSPGINIVYHGKKAVTVNLLQQTDANSIIVCDGYESDSFSGKNITVDKSYPAFPYGNTCIIHRPPSLSFFSHIIFFLLM